MGRIFGYARVSTAEQNLDRQLIELEKYVRHENIITDKASGKDLDRSGYQALKGALGLRKGDTLYIMSLDRLSRNKENIKSELEWFKNNGVRLIVLDLPTTMIDVPTGQQWIIDMINNILIEVLSSIAQQERENIRKRQRQGIDAAKLKGKHLGRPKTVIPDEWDYYYNLYQKHQITASEMMHKLSIPKSTFYKLLKTYNNNNGGQ